MKQTKTTKNKYLRRLVRDYEIERNRPRGIKLLDLLLRNTKLECFKTPTFFVATNVFNECNGEPKHKGVAIWESKGLKKSTALITDLENLFYYPLKSI